MSNKTFNYPFKVGSPEHFGTVLTNLNEKLDDMKKQVSYFDFYNITDVVTDPDSFATKINNLPLNQSLVINTSPFYYSGDDYSPGDVVIKNYLGEYYHIKAQTGGVFYPEKIEGKDGSYTIHFGFNGTSPTEGNVEAVWDQDVATASFAKTITYTGLKSSTEQSIYGEWGPIVSNQYNFNKCTTPSGVAIKPFIQFYFISSIGVEEQVYIDYKLEEVDGKWTITVSETADNSIYVKVK